MSKSNKLVFFGNERLATGLPQTAAPTLNLLIKNGYDISAVVASYSKGRSRSARELEIAEIAKSYNIPLLLPEKLDDIEDELRGYSAQAAILVAYGKIVPKGIIDIFPRGIINIHPSLLPLYRGPTPIEQTILDGASKTGVSIMRLAQRMDAGPVIAQQELELDGQESKDKLANELLKLGGELLLKHLPKIIDGSALETLQDETHATYTNLLTKKDGLIDWRISAEVIERQVRAFAGFPKSKAEVLGRDVIITKARVAKSNDDGALVIKCQPGWLEVQELTAPSGRTISGSEFLRGYGK